MNIKAEEIFEKDDWEKYNKQERKLNYYLIKSGISQKEAQEIFKVVSTSEKNRIAANKLGTQANRLSAEMNKINAEYKDPKTSDKEAKKLAKQYRSLEKEVDKLDEKRNYFLDKFYNTSNKVDQYMNKLKSILLEKGYELPKDLVKKRTYSKRTF